jgi:hypothetical protein
MSVTVNGTSGLVFSDGTTQGTAGYSGLRNRLINGAFNIWQRGTAMAATNNGLYVADRWRYTRYASSQTAYTQQATGMAEFPLCARIGRQVGDTGDTAYFLTQALEIQDSRIFKNKTATLSFWARKGSAYQGKDDAGVSGNISASISYHTGSVEEYLVYNNFITQSTVVNQGNFTPTTTWQKFTLNLSGNFPDNLGQVGVAFYSSGQTGTATANDYFEVTGAQLEIGTSASYFDHRPAQVELAMCQRYYYQRAFRVPCLPWVGTNNYTCGHMVDHPVTMRVSPSISALVTATISTTIGSLPNGTTASQSAVNITYETTVSHALITNNQSGQVVFGITGSYAANAEL